MGRAMMIRMGEDPHLAPKDTKDFNKGQFLGDAPRLTTPLKGGDPYPTVELPDTPAPPREYPAMPRGGWKDEGIPNPGSYRAVEMGCICPQMDNQYGFGIEGCGEVFWINQICPVHGHMSDRSIGKRVMK
jgi:hypothetical protein